jgi:transcriptional regulator pvuIIC
MKEAQSTENIPEIRLRFAQNLRTLRRLKNISQEELAFAAGISRVYLSDVERGNRAVTIDVMGKLAVGLDVDLVLLLDENPLQHLA